MVRQIYDSFLGGHSLRMIEDALEAKAVPTVSLHQPQARAQYGAAPHVPDPGSPRGDRQPGHLPRSQDGVRPPQRRTGPQPEAGPHRPLMLQRQVRPHRSAGVRRVRHPVPQVRVEHAGRKKAVWRCASRIDYGSTYCHESPTLQEGPLQAAILAVLSSVMSRKDYLLGQIEDAMRTELAPIPGETMSLPILTGARASRSGSSRSCSRTPKRTAGT